MGLLVLAWEELALEGLDGFRNRHVRELSAVVTKPVGVAFTGEASRRRLLAFVELAVAECDPALEVKRRPPISPGLQALAEADRATIYAGAGLAARAADRHNELGAVIHYRGPSTSSWSL
jgi:hypothetical protein